jgi:hypothetical protein
VNTILKKKNKPKSSLLEPHGIILRDRERDKKGKEKGTEREEM